MKSQNQKIKRLSQLMAFSFIMEMLVCWKLWFSIDREFPKMSAFSWFHFSLGSWGDMVLSLILSISLVFIAIDKYRNLAISIMLSCFLVLILEDITRFQPWVYTQGTILFLISFNKKGREKSILFGVLLVVALVYMWSGIQKFNLGFFRDIFPWLLSAFEFNTQMDSNQTLGSLNYILIIVPIIEFTMGLLLLISRTRKIGIITGIIMHVFILLSLGPTGHHWNIVVWPWNVSLILFLSLYYSPKEYVNISEEIQLLKKNYLVLILFGFMPVLNFIGYWDDALSGTLYSGTHSNVEFYLDIKNETEFAKFRNTGMIIVGNKKNKYDDDSTSKIWLNYWSNQDLKVPLYSAYRYYSRFGEKLCKQIKNPLKAGIEITTRSKFTGNKVMTKCNCSELLKLDYE